MKPRLAYKFSSVNYAMITTGTERETNSCSSFIYYRITYGLITKRECIKVARFPYSIQVCKLTLAN